MASPLEVVVWDYDSDGTHDLIGQFRASLQALADSPNKQWLLINPKKQGRYPPLPHNIGVQSLNMSVELFQNVLQELWLLFRQQRRNSYQVYYRRTGNSTTTCFAVQTFMLPFILTFVGLYFQISGA